MVRKGQFRDSEGPTKGKVKGCLQMIPVTSVAQPDCRSLLRIDFPRASSGLSEFGNPDAYILRALSKPLGVRAVVREGSALKGALVRAQPLPLVHW